MNPFGGTGTSTLSFHIVRNSETMGIPLIVNIFDGSQPIEEKKVFKVSSLKNQCSRFIIKERIEFDNPEEVVQDCIDHIYNILIKEYYNTPTIRETKLYKKVRDFVNKNPHEAYLLSKKDYIFGKVLNKYFTHICLDEINGINEIDRKIKKCKKINEIRARVGLEPTLFDLSDFHFYMRRIKKTLTISLSVFPIPWISFHQGFNKLSIHKTSIE